MSRILIADDERDIRELISFTLRLAGHQVTATSNGEEAWQTALRELPDLILMDVRMPRMSGYEACRQLKLLDQTKHIPVVFLSAKGQEAEVQTGLNAGAQEYMLKPFEPMQLMERVRQLLSQPSTGNQPVAGKQPFAGC